VNRREFITLVGATVAWPLAARRERAVRAEDWLLRIHNEVEQTFFPEKERQNGRREK
jgi:hypothetical protein